MTYNKPIDISPCEKRDEIIISSWFHFAITSMIDSVDILLLLCADFPFTLLLSGNVRNTKALDHSVQQSYILSIVAKHCDGLVSKPTILNIQVSQICSNGWKGMQFNELVIQACCIPQPRVQGQKVIL